MRDTKVEVDLNQANARELTALPGVGQKLAEKIVNYRQENHLFTDAADLVAVPGISEQMVGELQEHLIVHVPEEIQTAPDSEKTGREAKEKRAATKKPVAKDSSPSEHKKSGEAEQQLRALRAAAKAGDAEKVAKLIEDGANGRDKFALLWAAQEGHNQVVVRLMKAGANANSRSAAGGPNALALAAQNGHLEVVQTLVDGGADVNQPAMQGWTPLMKAAFFGHDEIVQCLLEAGAETRAQDVRGRTAADHAQRADNQQVATLLTLAKS